jgi:hypothetical protein
MDDDAARELEAATVAARRELGPEHDDHLIAGFLERIDHEIDRRVQDRSVTHIPTRHLELGAAVPILIVSGIFGGPAGIMIALVVLGVVSLATNRRG